MCCCVENSEEQTQYVPEIAATHLLVHRLKKKIFHNKRINRY